MQFSHRTVSVGATVFGFVACSCGCRVSLAVVQGSQSGSAAGTGDTVLSIDVDGAPAIYSTQEQPRDTNRHVSSTQGLLVLMRCYVKQGRVYTCICLLYRSCRSSTALFW